METIIQLIAGTQIWKSLNNGTIYLVDGLTDYSLAVWNPSTEKWETFTGAKMDFWKDDTNANFEIIAK